ncbi:MAG: transposase [Syntrophaceae bacterium]
MPRQARIDAPEALHHIIIRGIERRDIFRDDEDRLDYLRRIAVLLTDTHTTCFAWALMSNHVHLLLQTGDEPMATFMRRLLTGHAVHFNHRYKRHGALFQNRYKSILCQKEAYLLELVRYIHLNPLRAGVVKDMDELDTYAYCGHAALLGKIPYGWQETEFVLDQFSSRSIKQARMHYYAYMEQGVGQKRPDLVGGGLRRSLKGWSEAPRGEIMKGDERILGDSTFVQKALAIAEERLERRIQLRMRGFGYKELSGYVEKVLGVPKGTVFAHGRTAVISRARSLFCYWAVKELGAKPVELAREFDQTPPAITVAVRRGERLAEENEYVFDKSELFRC